MAEVEREVIQKRLVDLGLVGDGFRDSPYRRFRINAGQAWVAAPKATLHPAKNMLVPVGPDDVVLHRARVFHGAPVGWPDLAGWDTVEISEAMVGMKVAVFAGDEIKTEHMQLSREQRIFRDLLLRMGGRFEVIR